MTTAVANLAQGLGSADDIKLGGKTIVQNTEALTSKNARKRTRAYTCRRTR